MRSNWIIVFVSEVAEALVWTFFGLFGTQDAQLAKAHSERDSRRQRKEEMTDEKDRLVAHVDLLKRLVVSPCQPFLVYSRNQYSEYIWTVFVSNTVRLQT